VDRRQADLSDSGHVLTGQKWERCHSRGYPGSVTVEQLTSGVFRVIDTCNVYVIRSGVAGTSGIAIDFGSGAVLDHLAEMEVSHLTHVLMTHHHRDQGQGLPRAVEAGIEVWVPPVEVELFTQADELWHTRRIANDYQLGSDRQSLLASVPVTGTVPEYRSVDFGGVTVRTRPTPGHTPGSVSYLVDRGDERLAFSGDLIYGPGKVWSMMSMQWTYTGNEGPAMTMTSALLMQDERPDVLLPSHGEPMHDPDAALTQLFDHLQDYVDSRMPEGVTDVRQRLDNPFRAISDHLLINTSAESNSYVLLSETGNALVIDYGYDMASWYPLGGPRASQRPWLESIPALKRHYGVTRVEVAVPTHYHDDHCAGMNLLREVEGTEIWVPANVAPIMADPLRYDLPCQWFDPIPADRVLDLGQRIKWREYELTTYALPGHTLYAAAIEFEVDGMRVLATGDQHNARKGSGTRRDLLNYQYRNLVALDDFTDGAELYRTITPDLMITGHWSAHISDDGLLGRLADAGRHFTEQHRALLPLDELNMPLTGQFARIVPYFQQVQPGERVTLRVEVMNPSDTATDAVVELVGPVGWRVAVDPVRLRLLAGQVCTGELEFTVPAEAVPGRRAVLGIDVTIGPLRLGQHAEALVLVTEPALVAQAESG